MTLTPELAQMAQELRDSVVTLKPSDQEAVWMALDFIKDIVSTYGEAGSIALSIAAADFAAE